MKMNLKVSPTASLLHSRETKEERKFGGNCCIFDVWRRESLKRMGEKISRVVAEKRIRERERESMWSTNFPFFF